MLYTNAIGKTRNPIIHNIFEIYNHLFDHIEKIADRLHPKRQKWKIILHEGLWAARNKLQKYYNQTNQSYDIIYAYAAFLDFSKKFIVFDSRDFTATEKKGFV